jgi:hypothetical protein
MTTDGGADVSSANTLKVPTSGKTNIDSFSLSQMSQSLLTA